VKIILGNSYCIWNLDIAIKPFKITCNTTVATYLMKCKDPINGFKKNGKEHVYNTIYNSYKVLQDKFIEYLNNDRPRKYNIIIFMKIDTVWINNKHFKF